MPPKRKAAVMPAAKGTTKKYGMAPILPAGEVLTDFYKKTWILGKSFASGGFGRIYYAKQGEDTSKTENFVIKIEPAENGPLFQEIHMYTRIGKPSEIDQYKTEHRLSFLGIPAHHGSGSFARGSLTFRFLVLPRFGPDIEKVRASQPEGYFHNVADVFRLALTCLDVLAYLHSRNIVHADLKGENLLLAANFAPTPSNLHRAYLVDYGLARRVPENVAYKEAPKKAHDGTLIFTSLDAHKGCSPVYRDDVEILGYNIIFWLKGSFPWSDKSAEQVMKDKLQLSFDPKKQLAAMFGRSTENSLLVEQLALFFSICYTTDYASRPDYDRLKETIRNLMDNKHNVRISTTTSSTKCRPSKVPAAVVASSVNSNGDNVPRKAYAVPLKNTPPDLPLKHSNNEVNVTSRRRRHPPESSSKTSFAPPDLEPDYASNDVSDDDLFTAKSRNNKGAIRKRTSKSRPLVHFETGNGPTTADEELEEEAKDTVALHLPPSQITQRLIPGLANLKGNNKREVLHIPSAAFRRRKSIEASLLTKYRKLTGPKSSNANSENAGSHKILSKNVSTRKGKTKKVVEESNSEDDDDHRINYTRKLKNVETQTSPYQSRRRKI